MAHPSQETVDMFINITGAPESLAIQKLQEHNGDLSLAINAYYSEGDRTVTNQGSQPDSGIDYMNIDDPIHDEPVRPAFPLFPSAQGLNPFSFLDSNLRRRFFEGEGITDFFDHGPRVSHPRESRQIPIEFKDDNGGSNPSGLGPRIEEVTGREPDHHPEVHGTVIIDDDDDEDENVQTYPIDHGRVASNNALYGQHPEPSAPFVDATDYPNDIEEEMIKAAIEASKREAELHASGQDMSIQQASATVEDTDLVQAVNLSLKAAEQERTLHGHDIEENKSAFDSSLEGVGRTTTTNGRQVYVPVENGTSSRLNFEEGLDEDEEVEEQPLVRHRSRHISSESGQASSPPSSSPQRDTDSHSVDDLHAFQTDEWGGISSEERNEAVMLEAAMFGGIPEGSSFPFAFPSQAVESSSARNPTFYPRVPRPTSPRLTEERLLREQQDGEYFAALQADQEKELKAKEEEELRRLEDAAARESALKNKRLEEEENLRKQLEEEELVRKLAAKEASLPPEPSPNDENSVTLLIRMPDGSRRGRRFRKSDKLQFLFDFVDIGRVVKPGSYRLVRPYPRRAFTVEDSNLSFSELGLDSRQEALFLETI